jgi:hypothetical protein
MTSSSEVVQALNDKLYTKRCYYLWENTKDSSHSIARTTECKVQ